MQVVQPLLEFIPRFAGDFQLSHGNRVVVSVGFREFGRPQVKHKLRGRARKLCTGS